MTKLTIPFIETMITQVCNLSCHGCTNYSDLDHQGYVRWDDGKAQIENWLERLNIPDFGIMGGEPLINPQWRRWLYGVRELMPESQIRFTTNGLLLRKYPDIIDEMIEVGNVVFKITAHTNDADDFINQALSRYQWNEVTEHGISRWAGKNNIRFQVNRPDKFIKTYQNNYNNMLPWNSNPVEAFDNCVQQTCPLLYQGRIYKCSTAGLLKDTLDYHKNINYNYWDSFIDKGLSAKCSDRELSAFVNNFGKPNKVCGQCPTRYNEQAIINHNLTVKVR